MKTKWAWLMFGALLWLSTTAIGQTKPSVDAAPSIGPMRVRQMPAFDYMYSRTQTTLNDLPGDIDSEVTKLMTAVKTNNILSTGEVVFIYHNPSGQPKQRFDLDVGIEVPAGTAAPKGYTVEHKPAVLSATLLYGGSTADLQAAYRELFSSISTRDFITTGETREYYLHWEDRMSPNNVIWITAVVD